MTGNIKTVHKSIEALLYIRSIFPLQHNSSNLFNLFNYSYTFALLTRDCVESLIFGNLFIIFTVILELT